jgi:hypothetical protein
VRCDHTRQRGEHVGTREGARSNARQGHFLILEIVALGNGCPHALRAGVGADEARGETEGQLVRIVDAIPAGKLVLGIDGREVDVLLGAVEYGNVVLVAEGDIDVVQPRFQGLQEGRAPDRGRTLEYDARVRGENRQRAGLVGESGAVGVDEVVRRIESEFGSHGSICRLQRHAQARIGHHAGASGHR